MPPLAIVQRPSHLSCKINGSFAHNRIVSFIWSNPNAKLKHSGIEWIGAIPEHWEVLKLRRLLLKIEQGNSPNAAQGNGDADQWKVITLSAVCKGEFRKDAYKPISASTVQKEANTSA